MYLWCKCGTVSEVFQKTTLFLTFACFFFKFCQMLDHACLGSCPFLLPALYVKKKPVCTPDQSLVVQSCTVPSRTKKWYHKVKHVQLSQWTQQGLAPLS